jgi:hypothetical protein
LSLLVHKCHKDDNLKIADTKIRGWVVNTSVSYCGSPVLTFCPGAFLVFLTFSTLMPGQCLKSRWRPLPSKSFSIRHIFSFYVMQFQSLKSVVK